MALADDFREHRRLRSLTEAGAIRLYRAYLPLHWEGPMWSSLCPFHDDEVGWFVVDGGTRRWSCRVCKMEGDIVDFVAYYEQVDREEALRLVRLAIASPNYRDDAGVLRDEDGNPIEEQG
jgi:DNA primase